MGRRVLIRGGFVVAPDSSDKADVLLDGGKIAAVGKNIPTTAAGVTIDADGTWVLPGGVDPHVHIQVQFDRFETTETPESCSLAALYGGTTTLIDFAIPRSGQGSIDAALEHQRMAKQCLTETLLHGCLVEWNDSSESDLREMESLGVRNIKMFTTYSGILMLPEEGIRRVLRFLGKSGGIALFHAEANEIVHSAQERLARHATIDAAYHAKARPPDAEARAVERVLSLPEAKAATIYFVHLSTPEAVDMVRNASREGQRVYAETCPHYLLFDDSVYEGDAGAGFVCCPPMRPKNMVEALMGKLLLGEIDSIGSDHCCFSVEQKRSSRGDVRNMPYGLPGVETRLPVLFSELIHKRGMPPEDFVRLVSTNPATIFGLSTRKGSIAVGLDADVVLWDPTARWTVRARDLHMATDYSPFEGWTVIGRPRDVIIGGRTVIRDGELTEELGPGRAAMEAQDG